MVKVITQYDSPNYTPGSDCLAVFGYPRNLLGDTIHHWNEPGKGDTWASTFNTLMDDYRRPGSRGVSAHYLVEAGKAACLVSPLNAAWACGSKQGNAQTVSWELHPNESAGTYQTFAEALAESWVQVPRPHKLFKHSDWVGTECPGTYDLPRLLRMAEAEYAKLTGTKPAPKPPVKPVPKPKPAAPKFIATVDPGDTFTGIAAQFGVTLAALKAVNPGIDYNKIRPGQKIWVPGVYKAPVSKFTATVDPGDTFTGIAAQFGVTLAALKAVNPGIDYNKIRPGQKIWVPTK